MQSCGRQFHPARIVKRSLISTHNPRPIRKRDRDSFPPSPRILIPSRLTNSPLCLPLGASSGVSLPGWQYTRCLTPAPQRQLLRSIQIGPKPLPCKTPRYREFPRSYPWLSPLKSADSRAKVNYYPTPASVRQSFDSQFIRQFFPGRSKLSKPFRIFNKQ